MRRARPRRTKRGTVPSAAELRVLRFIQFGELYRQSHVPRPTLTVDLLAGWLELGTAVCCQALYWLVRRGDLEAQILDGGGFRLIPASLPASADPVEPLHDP